MEKLMYCNAVRAYVVADRPGKKDFLKWQKDMRTAARRS